MNQAQGAMHMVAIVLGCKTAWSALSSFSRPGLENAPLTLYFWYCRQFSVWTGLYWSRVLTIQSSLISACGQIESQNLYRMAESTFGEYPIARSQYKVKYSKLKAKDDIYRIYFIWFKIPFPKQEWQCQNV